MHGVHVLKNPRADGLFNRVLRFIPVHLLNSQPLLKSDDVPEFFICLFLRKKDIRDSQSSNSYPLLFRDCLSLCHIGRIKNCKWFWGEFLVFYLHKSCSSWVGNIPCLRIFGFVSRIIVYFLLANHHYIAFLRLLRHTTQGKLCSLKNMVLKVSKSKCMSEDVSHDGSTKANDPSFFMQHHAPWTGSLEQDASRLQTC